MRTSDVDETGAARMELARDKEERSDRIALFLPFFCLLVILYSRCIMTVRY
jgi:hypothetical protein